jgi:hypothetical protein
MTGFEMYGKAMKVSKSKTHSDETVKLKAPDMFDEHKRKRLMQKGTLDRGMWGVTVVLTRNRLQARRGRCKSPGQPSSHCTEAARSQVWSCCNTRRVRATEQDALPAGSALGCQRGVTYEDLRTLPRLQGSSLCRCTRPWVCRIRKRAVRYRGKGVNSKHANRCGRQANEGRIPETVGLLRVVAFAFGIFVAHS